MDVWLSTAGLRPLKDITNVPASDKRIHITIHKVDNLLPSSGDNTRVSKLRMQRQINPMS